MNAYQDQPQLPLQKNSEQDQHELLQVKFPTKQKSNPSQ